MTLRSSKVELVVIVEDAEEAEEVREAVKVVEAVVMKEWAEILSVVQLVPEGHGSASETYSPRLLAVILPVLLLVSGKPSQPFENVAMSPVLSRATATHGIRPSHVV